MKYRPLGRDNVPVSVLGYGCMRLPLIDNDYSRIDDEKAEMQLRYAIDHGINYVDTAYGYHGGNSETFLAKALGDGYREKVLLATKMPSWLIKEKADLERILAEQLAKLNTDHIDFYLLHALNKGYFDNYVRLDVFAFLETARQAGKIRNIGFSFHDDHQVFAQIINAYQWDFCQIQLNYYDEEYQAGLKGMRLAADRGIDVIVMEPLRGGSLALNPPEAVRDLWNAYPKKHTPAGWALRYLWDKPEVKVVLSGMNDLDHIKDNIAEASAAEAGMLSNQERELITKVKQEYKSRIKVDCTNCKYCMPCPHGVNIPRNFAFYNDAHIFGDFPGSISAYQRFVDAEERAGMCQACGHCEPLCPQHISIIKQLTEVAAFFNPKQ